MSELPPLHVVVRFGAEIPLNIQGPALLEFERVLRQYDLAFNGASGRWIEVFKDYKGDESKLRNAMTPAQRARL